MRGWGWGEGRQAASMGEGYVTVNASQPGITLESGLKDHDVVPPAQARLSAPQTSHGRQMQTSPRLITHHMASRQAGTGTTCVFA